ncbi:uncharacterized protein [Onthophagus taurus]|uniref:uncharacterized protein n=1 Tax=Onthophagus taurus TaxID=166361 RepID=UPI0039BDD5E3
MFVATIFLILVITAINSTSACGPYYWKICDGAVPDDAVLTEDTTIFVSRVCAGGHHDRMSCYTATYNSIDMTSTANVNRHRDIFYKNRMILCTSNPELLRWEFVNIESLTGDFLNKVVSAGSLDGTDRYVGKVFHENEWKISTVEPGKGLLIWANEDGTDVVVTDFQVLVIQ